MPITQKSLPEVSRTASIESEVLLMFLALARTQTGGVFQEHLERFPQLDPPRNIATADKGLSGVSGISIFETKVSIAPPRGRVME